jgi:hypothetical protein
MTGAGGASWRRRPSRPPDPLGRGRVCTTPRREVRRPVNAHREWAVGAGEIAAPNFSITLDLTEKGYWLAIVDDEDACGLRFISNDRGVIFHAEPIR